MCNIIRIATNRYEKDLKVMLKRGKDLSKMLYAIDLIFENAINDFMPHLLLPTRYRLHKLVGQYKDRWECHIEPDWLLVFYLDDEKLVLERTGTHSDLFK